MISKTPQSSSMGNSTQFPFILQGGPFLFSATALKRMDGVKCLHLDIRLNPDIPSFMSSTTDCSWVCGTQIHMYQACPVSIIISCIRSKKFWWMRTLPGCGCKSPLLVCCLEAFTEQAYCNSRLHSILLWWLTVTPEKQSHSMWRAKPFMSYLDIHCKSPVTQRDRFNLPRSLGHCTYRVKLMTPSMRNILFRSDQNASQVQTEIL